MDLTWQLKEKARVRIAWAGVPQAKAQAEGEEPAEEASGEWAARLSDRVVIVSARPAALELNIKGESPAPRWPVQSVAARWPENNSLELLKQKRLSWFIAITQLRTFELIRQAKKTLTYKKAKQPGWIVTYERQGTISSPLGAWNW